MKNDKHLAGMVYDSTYTADDKIDDILREYTHNKLEIGNHSISINSHSLTCKHCDEEKEIPQLIKQGSGFREVVYKLYLLSEFRTMSCESKHGDVGVSPTLKHTDNGPYYWPDYTTISGSNTLTVSGDSLSEDEKKLLKEKVAAKVAGRR